MTAGAADLAGRSATLGAPMSYGLADGVSYCVAEGRGVALDLRRDRYFGLNDRQTEALMGLARGSPGALQSAALASLVTQGLLIAGEEHPAPVPCAHIGPTRSLDEQVRPRSSTTLLDFAEVAFIVITIWLQLKTTPLATVIARRLRRRRIGLEASGASDAEALGHRFATLRRLVPIGPICLLDSLALADFLARRGCHADVVFAVGVAPFAAHAWAQAGDCALNETVHRTAMLTPILVV